MNTQQRACELVKELRQAGLEVARVVVDGKKIDVERQQAAADRRGELEMTKDYALNEIRENISSMDIGQRITFSRGIIMDVKENWLVGESKIDRIYAGLIGSSYNLRHWTNHETGDVTFEKVESDGRKWWEYPDRRHLYTENPDGSLRILDNET